MILFDMVRVPYAKPLRRPSYTGQFLVAFYGRKSKEPCS